MDDDCIIHVSSVYLRMVVAFNVVIEDRIFIVKDNPVIAITFFAFHVLVIHDD